MDLQSLAQQAIAFHQQGNLAEAEKLYLQILDAGRGLFGPGYYLGLMRLQPSNVVALNNPGLTLRTLQRLPEAVQAHEQVLALMPGHGDARYNLGVALLDLQRSAEALAAFDVVVPERPNDTELLNNRGV